MRDKRADARREVDSWYNPYGQKAGIAIWHIRDHAYEVIEDLDV